MNESLPHVNSFYRFDWKTYDWPFVPLVRNPLLKVWPPLLFAYRSWGWRLFHWLSDSFAPNCHPLSAVDWGSLHKRCVYRASLPISSEVSHLHFGCPFRVRGTSSLEFYGNEHVPSLPFQFLVSFKSAPWQRRVIIYKKRVLWSHCLCHCIGSQA